MRLQSAVFVIEETLPGREDAGKVLSILKMEGVWMYGVTALERAEAERALADAGLADAKLYEKAMRRLRSEPRDTIVFAGRLDSLRAAKAAGLRTAAVRGAADADEWAAMCAEAGEIVERYADFLA